MPIMDGREALREIKNDPTLKSIVVVVFTTSQEEEDKILSYNLGVNSFIRKPVKHLELITALTLFKKYWLELVELPE